MVVSSDSEPLYLHTLKTLCDELVSGRPVLLDNEGNEFKLSSAETRSIFDWYRRNQNKWAGNVLKKDVEDIVDQLDKEPPELPLTAGISQNKQKRILHLRSILAHHFAGIHWYGSTEAPLDDFYFEFDKPLTLIQGMNGAGKTSLLSEITWCLTGHVYRSQRKPETVGQPVLVEISGEEENSSEDETTYDMSAITPMPSAEILQSLGGTPLPIDTWVELTFVDEAGNEAGKVRRSVERNQHGKIVINEPDFSTLDLDPISREIGTRMPGLIPYIQLGATSDLGKAVAEITGIKPLEDVVKHATKSKVKLQKDLVKDRGLEIEDLDIAFNNARIELDKLIEENPDISPNIPPPLPGPATTLESEIETLKQHFEDLQTKALEEAKSILGYSFDPSDPIKRKDLMDNVGPALGQLDDENLKRLQSAIRLRDLFSLTNEEVSQVETLVQQLVEEANELEDLAENPDIHARLRLYARIAGWIKDLPNPLRDVTDCPVCQSALKDKTDEFTGKNISDHIQRHLEMDSDYLEKTLTAWEQNAVAVLSNELPSQLKAEISKDLPVKPADLIYSAIGEELFKSIIFKSSLAPLQTSIQSLCRTELDGLPSFEEPTAVTLPKSFQKENSNLVQIIGRLTRAIAFARWQQQYDEVCEAAYVKIIGQIKPDQNGVDSGATSLEGWSLSQRLNALDTMVKSTTPITEGLSKVKTMNDNLSARRMKENRIALYKKAAVAIDGLLGLRDLVERQVAFLMKELLSTTLQWKKDFYLPAFTGAPEIVDADVTTNGSLVINAAADGAKASAYHISNASDLRATLLGFLIAFWQYLLENHGGLSLLLLDDLHELFDHQNRRRVANSVPSLVSSGRKVIVTTNDPTFGRRVMAASKRADVERRRIHPLNAPRHHIELGQFVETIEEKRREFERPENKNQPQPAIDYINNLRIYLENQLLDFFDTAQPGLPHNPTLLDLTRGLRTRQNNTSEPFSGSVFTKLLSDPAITDNSPFLRLMNSSHHGNEDEITFNDVWQVREVCVRLRKLVDAAHEEYERWMRRDPREPTNELPDLVEPIVPPNFSVPIITDLAAFVADQPISEAMQSDELFSSNWFTNHAVYIINTDNLGFAGARNYRAIVDLSDEPPKDNDLVIALYQDKVFARRLLHDSIYPETITLGSEAANPLKRLHSLVLPINEVRLLKIIGILFDDQPHYPKPAGEAVLVNDVGLLRKVELVFRIVGDSAIPLALDNQVILGGNSVVPSQLKEMEGQLVAVATSEGTAFKRVSKIVPGVPHLRQFESIGGLGESMLIRTEELEDSFDNLPLLISTRHILGVLYGPTG